MGSGRERGGERDVANRLRGHRLQWERGAPGCRQRARRAWGHVRRERRRVSGAERARPRHGPAAPEPRGVRLRPVLGPVLPAARAAALRVVRGLPGALPRFAQVRSAPRQGHVSRAFSPSRCACVAPQVLVVGCGNSELSEQMYDVGMCEDIVNIDVSDAVIRQMQERSRSKRPKMSYLLMDMLQMDFPDAHFQVVLDKGTLDAILTDEEEATLAKVDKMFAEISRVLQVGGRYLCVSLAQAHVLKKAVEYFSQEGWVVRVHQVAGSRDKQQFVLPVFVYVMTKFRKIPGSAPQILEICPEEQDKPMRVETVERLVAAVKDRQHYALLCSQLSKPPCGEQVSLDLCDKESGRPRYTLHVVDSPSLKPSRDNHFAIFIIPQGRETEWLFGTEEGRRQLATSAGFRRLVTVALHREQHYEGMAGIQAELSGKVMELAPPGLPARQQVPFVSVGGDIGVRTVRHRDTSTLSGEYVIEDVKGDGTCYFRRLIFLRNRNVVQSEARLLAPMPLPGQKKRRKDKKKPSPTEPPAAIDKSYLCCEHHKAMVAGLCLLGGPNPLPGTLLAVLVVGLGGGSLPVFIHDYFSQAHVAVVEIDPSMLEVATRWFGFSQDDRMQVHVSDGLDYVAKLAAEAPAQYDAIMFDVDSKDLTVGMSCPPPAFVEKPFLQKVKTTLKPEGVFVLNLVCRDARLKESVLATLREVFPLLYARRIEEEVNEILFCQPSPEGRRDPTELEARARALEGALRQPGRPWDSSYVLADMLQAIKIL
ncbi:eEF1A lysine and N-terminal methyltransferase isoform X1 [Aquila chrysaetos chrysaetos]|uniref:eEF1A lysine and N-terminal methyltransferase isoform X1 n=2 Tax=Aquila chrysaetos chrysaetos TaxID=223781 RepID=UPI001B7D3A2F|nr:eEF1A lysine and N-terminal methyltransferase isoform X1 [Aquila chrysaetos chrysaetos]